MAYEELWVAQVLEQVGALNHDHHQKEETLCAQDLQQTDQDGNSYFETIPRANVVCWLKICSSWLKATLLNFNALNFCLHRAVYFDPTLFHFVKQTKGAASLNQI